MRSQTSKICTIPLALTALLAFAGAGSASRSAHAQTPKFTLAVMARDAVKGKSGLTEPVGAATTFKASDHTIYCIFRLSKPMAGASRVVWTAVHAETLPDNTKIYENATKPMPNLQYGKFSIASDRDWPKGRYKADIYLNGKLQKTLAFAVK